MTMECVGLSERRGLCLGGRGSWCVYVLMVLMLMRHAWPNLDVDVGVLGRFRQAMVDRTDYLTALDPDL